MIKGPYMGALSAHCGNLFTAEDPDVSPLELFDQERWAECAHTCVYLLWRTQDPQRALAAMNDERFLHELLHLASNAEISTHNHLANIREEIIDLMKASYQTMPTLA